MKKIIKTIILILLILLLFLAVYYCYPRHIFSLNPEEAYSIDIILDSNHAEKRITDSNTICDVILQLNNALYIKIPKLFSFGGSRYRMIINSRDSKKSYLIVYINNYWVSYENTHYWVINNPITHEYLSSAN